MKPVLVDSGVLIQFLRGDRRARDFVETLSDRMMLSTLVVAELYSAVRDESELAALDEFISLFRVIPVTEEIARAGAALHRGYGLRHGISITDAILAATAETENAELKTLNPDQYPMLENLRPAWSK
jgi:predicted nucleic acid-binding protein